MTPFTSTYRVQLHKDFGLDDARALAPYWRDLGIGACYTSPVFAAQPGSMHGYDVTDPTVINPELGGRDAFDRFARALRDANLGLLLDIVPNHQAATTRNPSWYAMLAGGPDSNAARTFDVDWSGNDGEPGRLVWPLLGDEIGTEIAAGNLRLEPALDGSWRLRYFNELLPVNGPVDDRSNIEDVLAAQHYKLVDWRTGARARNYRRFFDVSTLAGVRVEDENVFRATHTLVFELVHSGGVTGLRVDHIDGLADPQRYLDRLAAATGGVYTVVEKILAADELLPDDWPVQGTTGYDALDELCGIFIDPAGRAVLEDRFHAETGGTRFPSVQRAAKRQVLEQLFEPEWARLRRALVETAKAAGIDVGEHEGAEALAAATIALRVYRTFIRDGRARGEDRRRVAEAFAGARSEPGRRDDDALAAVARLVLGDDLAVGSDEARRRLLRHWQQLSGPIMAKGHEDTACYRYPVLLAQAEVGGDPGDPATDALARFHRRTIERHTSGQQGLVATSTHDTKRSEDVRARLAVLSELAVDFELALERWRDGLGHLEEVTPSELRFVAQTLLGSWPLEVDEHDGLQSYERRISRYMQKALREAKQHTSWLEPDVHHEAAVISVAQRSIADNGREFLASFGALGDLVAFHGACNSLAQVLVKVALPGLPDVYQGTELWDFSLVDPDNRRPVDYGRRRMLLEQLDAEQGSSDRQCTALRLDWRSGAIKLFVLSRALRARRERAALFVDGDYSPLAVSGVYASHAVAFARHLGDQWAVAVVPRVTTRIANAPQFPVGVDAWRDTAVRLPSGAPSEWRDALCPASIVTSGRELVVGEALSGLPVGLVVSS